MEIIIVGCGKVGSTLTEELSKEGHDISVIDINSKRLEEISNKFDTMSITGNGASYNVLKEAGIEKADLLIAVTNSDELNLLCCLVARKAGNCRTIARVRNPMYSEEAGFIKENLGLSMVINPEYESACEIERLLRFPSAIDIGLFSRGHVELLNFQVQKDSILAGMKIKDLDKKFKSDVLVCIVERGEEVIIPNGDFTITEGDLISIIAPHKKAIQFLVKVGIIMKPVKSTMIIGGGSLSYYLSKQLLDDGVSVTIIEQSRERCKELAELLPEAIIINGDGTDGNLLMEEGLMDTESLASLTGIDEQNIMLSLYAKTKTKSKIITKVNRICFDEVVDSLNLGSIISPKYITSEYILRYVRSINNSMGSNVETLYKIKKDKAEATEFYVNDDFGLNGIPLEQLNLKDNLIICCIYRNGKIITPKGQDSIQKGDYVVVVTTNSPLNNLGDILRR